MSSFPVPIAKNKNERWGDLCGAIRHHTVEIVGETWRKKKGRISFKGQHRVASYKVTRNVHFRIPDGLTLDIKGVAPAQALRRQGGNR